MLAFHIIVLQRTVPCLRPSQELPGSGDTGRPDHEIPPDQVPPVPPPEEPWTPSVLFSYIFMISSCCFIYFHVFFMQAGIPHIPEMPKQSKTPVHQSHPKIPTRLWETSKANSKPFKVYCIGSDILTQHDVCASWHTCFCRDSACADPICRQKGSKFSLSGMTCAVTPPRIPTVMQQVFHGYPIKPFKADSTLGMAFAKVLLEVVRLRQIKMMVKDGQGMSRNSNL